MKTLNATIREAFPGRDNAGIRKQIRALLADEDLSPREMGLVLQASTSMSNQDKAALASLEDAILAGVEWC